MSGFEVIGVVLGVYPIVVTAWEAFSLTKGDKGVQQMIRRLKIEETVYRGHVKHILGPNASEAQRCRLMTATSPANLDAWRDAALESNLRERYGYEKADLLLKILEDLSNSLESMKKELPGAGRAFETRSSKFFRSFKQNLPRSSLNEDIESLHVHNKDLARLLGERGPPSLNGPWKQPTPMLDFPRQDCSHVVDVYKAICDSYRCNCDKAHYANLELPQVPGSKSREGRALSYVDQKRLQLLFPFEDSVSDSAAAVVPENRPEEPDADEKTLVDHEEFINAQRQPERTIALPATLSLKTSPSTTSMDSKTRPVSIYECPLDQSDTIQDLCQYVRALRDEDAPSEVSSPPGILSSKDKRYKLQTSPRETLTASQKTVSLVTKFSDQQSPLSRRDRISLALRLSYAILQYYSTGWIDLNWSWKDFSVTDEQKFEDSHLFVKQKFYSTCGALPHARSDTTRLPGVWALIGEPILTRLGFALTELALGRRLSEMRDETIDKSLPDDHQDYWTAISILKSGKIQDAEGKGYEEVVRVCLQHQFWSMADGSMKMLNSEEPDFHKDVEKLVISPLHCMWSETWGDNKRQLCY